MRARHAGAAVLDCRRVQRDAAAPVSAAKVPLFRLGVVQGRPRFRGTRQQRSQIVSKCRQGRDKSLGGDHSPPGERRRRR